MIELYRSVPENFAFIQCDDDIIKVPWSDLLSLRDLVARVSPEAASDEDFHQVQGGWAVLGSPDGLTLMHTGAKPLHFSVTDWRKLGELLYIGDDLLMQTEVSEIVERAPSRVNEAIAMGKLFAFQVPDMRAQQWRIPRRAVKEWLE